MQLYKNTYEKFFCIQRNQCLKLKKMALDFPWIKWARERDRDFIPDCCRRFTISDFSKSAVCWIPRISSRLRNCDTDKFLSGFTIWNTNFNKNITKYTDTDTDTNIYSLYNIIVNISTSLNL